MPLRLRLPVSGRAQRSHQDRKWWFTLPSVQPQVSSSSDWGHGTKQKGPFRTEWRVRDLIFLSLHPSPEDPTRQQAGRWPHLSGMKHAPGMKPCILAFCPGSSWNGFLADNCSGLCSRINMEKVSLLWDTARQAPKLTWESCPRALGWTWGAWVLAAAPYLGFRSLSLLYHLQTHTRQLLNNGVN